MSKGALDVMARTYASEMENTPVRVNTIYPGPIRTAMRAKAMPGEDPDTLRRPADIAPKLVDMIEPGFTQNRVAYDFRDDTTKPL